MKSIQVIGIVIAITALGLGGYAVYEWKQPTEAAILTTYETVNLSFSDAINGVAINPVTKIVGTDVSYTRTITPTSGAYAWTDVEKGTYTFEMKLASYYTETETETISSTRDTTGADLDMYQIGTFSWGETAATGALTNNDNDQKVNFTVYLKNTAENTLLNDLRLKIYENDNFTGTLNVDSLTCNYALDVDDPSDGKWEISATELGDIEEVDVIAITFQIQVDVPNESGNQMWLKLVTSDLDGVSPKTSSAMWIKFTAA